MNGVTIMDKATLREEILSHISLPAIRRHEVSAAAYGIYPNSGENLQSLLQAAIDDLSAGGGGRLCLPAGTYRSGALQLKSGVDLYLESRAVLSSTLRARKPAFSLSTPNLKTTIL